MPDAHQSFGQYMHQEPADKFIAMKIHDAGLIVSFFFTRSTSYSRISSKSKERGTVMIMSLQEVTKLSRVKNYETPGLLRSRIAQTLKLLIVWLKSIK